MCEGTKNESAWWKELLTADELKEKEEEEEGKKQSQSGEGLIETRS